MRRDHAVLNTLLPTGSHPELPGLIEAGWDPWYAEFDATANASLRWGFRFATWFGVWVAPLLARRLPPLGRHDREVREAILASWFGHRWYLLRQLALVLKLVTSMFYGAHPEVRRALGFPTHPAPDPVTP